LGPISEGRTVARGEMETSIFEFPWGGPGKNWKGGERKGKKARIAPYFWGKKRQKRRGNLGVQAPDRDGPTNSGKTEAMREGCQIFFVKGAAFYRRSGFLKGNKGGESSGKSQLVGQL